MLACHINQTFLTIAAPIRMAQRQQRHLTHHNKLAVKTQRRPIVVPVVLIMRNDNVGTRHLRVALRSKL